MKKNASKAVFRLERARAGEPHAAPKLKNIFAFFAFFADKKARRPAT
jgi:hypothetical protein